MVDRFSCDDSAAPITIAEFTNPACPFAYSAEPVRWRMKWRYGGRIRWHAVLVGLSEDPREYLERGFTPDKQAATYGRLAGQYGEPLATHQRPRIAASVPACRAVVATRLHAPGADADLLRAIRIGVFSGQLVDEPETLRAAATDVGLDPDLLAEWTSEEQVEAAMRSDFVAARAPLPAATVLGKLAPTVDGGRRYTTPTYEVVRNADGLRIVIPGLQPTAVYDVILANVAPELEWRPAAPSVEAALAWAGAPLATKEVAVLSDLDADIAREHLEQVATEKPLGTDSFWELATAPTPTT